ncbi:MAG: hypothetical protein A2W05_09440 [Candidatus Schekmanbacteria bacterium RBG_16_38_10]|uniref:Amidohydrolase-related domain-containing protein n=1 Tax=Candidatus Schekmanbacteria bacterium RBG_16_38_10 TaxID=1817879 RepID=A0A1F7S0G5_9BACT|nr:MAG: hypothetical protein A2W05_09440 [Candidatus Schekmanbacteria bacterium RBG_16_38_10]
MILRAKFVVPDSKTVIENGIIEIDGDYIINVGRYSKTSNKKTLDLGNTIVIPGLVNAHCHLEFSALQGKVRNGIPLHKWILRCIELQKLWKREDWIKSVRMGLQMLAKNGITSVGDVCRRNYLLNILKIDQIRKVVFYEAINTSNTTAHITLREVEKTLQNMRPTNTFTLGVSPHSPYTVSQKLYKLLKNLSENYKVPLATHISETKEEVEFLMHRKGALAELIKYTNISYPFYKVPMLTPIEYLRKMGILSRNVNLIHANYLSRNDINIIADSGASVTFCPGSHEYFHHDRHPIAKLLTKGITVALGTDSLASNIDLSILREMAIVRKIYRVAPYHIFDMATSNGAKALFRNKRLGLIRKKYIADLTCLTITRNIRKQDIFDFLCSNPKDVAMTMVGGKIIYNKT